MRFLLIALLCAPLASAEPSMERDTVAIPRTLIQQMFQKNRELIDAAREATDEIDRLERDIIVLKAKLGCS